VLWAYFLPEAGAGQCTASEFDLTFFSPANPLKRLDLAAGYWSLTLVPARC
jgi:hypothetical protein